jgi:GntR family transcriptional regulator, rspAB operon transcriptional repressor
MDLNGKGHDQRANGIPELPPPVRRPQRREPTNVRVTAASLILKDIRNDILDMTLVPGTPLSEKILTERYKVSRTPVREALIRLAEEGLVDIFPQSGTFVGRIPVDALPEAVVVRQALELATIGLVIERATPADFALLDGLVARQEAMANLNDQNGFHDEDEAFHEALTVVAGHPGLWRVTQTAKTQIDRCRRLTLPMPGRMRHVIDEHTAVLSALKNRDRQACEAAMRKHLSSLLPDAAAIRSQFPDYFI